MKIGIMSMQRIINYGSFLQSYSLKKIIEELGHEVEFVDYEPGRVLVKRSMLLRIYRRIKRIINKPSKQQLEQMKKATLAAYQYDEIYKTEFLPLLGVGKEKNIRPQLDVLVIGSDEVFNCLQMNPDVGYAKDLFGVDNRANKLISYAASFGNTTIENLVKYKIDNEITEHLKKFNYISVRDLNSKKIVDTLLSADIELHIDPVFLFDYSELMPQKKMDKDYIVVYAYWSRITKNEAHEIIKFAKMNNKKIICLCAPQIYLENFVPATPFKVLAYIRDADYVITDTFHGTVFSIKYNKNFAVFLRKGHGKVYGNNEKLSSLLRHFNLTNRTINDLKFMESILKTDLIYEDINKKINMEKEKSKLYLKKAIEG